MTSPPDRLPDDAAVVAAIAPLVAGAADLGRVTLVSRRSNPYFSSSASEIIAVDVPQAGSRHLFVKYDRGMADPEPRCRQGLAYCRAVYERIVCLLPAPHAACIGLVGIGSPPVAALVLEHLADALRVNETADDSGVIAAAEWCGRLHAWGASKVEDPAIAFLVRYDEPYYRAWAARARTLTAAVGPVPAWFERVYGGLESASATLAGATRTTIHGEYGPQNILWRDGVVHPVDWESAAVGAAEIDLATLLFDWPADTVRRATDAYWRVRGIAPPPDFAAVFAAATLYTCLRWLPEPARGGIRGWEAGLARLERAAAQLG